MLLPVLLGVGLGDGPSADWSLHLGGCVISHQLIKLVGQCIIVQRLTKHIYLHLAHIHVLLVALVQFLPILDRHLLVQIFEHSIAFFQSSENFKICLRTLNTLHGLLKLDLGAVTLGHFRLDKLLRLQVNDGSLFLASLDELLDLFRGDSILLLQLLLIGLQFSDSSLDVQYGLVIRRYPIFPSAILHRSICLFLLLLCCRFLLLLFL